MRTRQVIAPREAKPPARRLALLTAATIVVLAAGTGCGSRASDREIAEAVAVLQSAQAVPVGPSEAGGPVTGGPGSAAGFTTPEAVELDEEQPNASSTSSDRPTGTPPSAAARPAAEPPTPAGTDPDDLRATGVSRSATGPANRPATKSEVRLGQVGSFSGVFGAVTSYSPRVLAAWVAHTNANGGLNGHPVRVIVGDDQGDPATALTLTKRMVQSDKILAMVANINVFGFAQIEKYTREKGVPLIGGDAVDPGWSTSPNSFPVTTSLLNQTIFGLKTMLAQGGTRIGIMYCLEVSALCSYLNEEVRRSPEVGSKVADSYQVSLVAPSYTSQCLRLKQAEVDVLWLALDGPAAARAARDCATQGFAPKIMLLSVDATKETPALPALDGALIPAGVFPTQAKGVPAIERYRQVLATYGPTIGDGGLGALAWAAAELLFAATKDLPDKPTSGDIYRGLWQIKNETLGGLTPPLTFVRNKPPQVKPCVFFWGMENGKWTAPTGATPQC